jgi:hypothetical protein
MQIKQTVDGSGLSPVETSMIVVTKKSCKHNFCINGIFVLKLYHLCFFITFPLVDIIYQFLELF